MKRVCAGIVTFDPDIELLDKCILALNKQVDRIIIVDNHSSNIDEISALVKLIDEVMLFKLKRNYGIAYALNRIMEIAEKHEYDYVLTLDQDTVIETDYVSRLMDIDYDQRTAVFCPVIFDRNRGVEDNSNKVLERDEEVHFMSVSQCVTSGAVTNVQIWKKLGKYDETLFIDNVDFDFCHRLIKEGYKILKNENVVINHAIGDGKVHKLLFWTITVHNHNAIRKYYISRNRIYTDYKCEKKIKIKSFASNIKLLLKTLLYEDNKILKFKAITRGTVDGIKLTRGIYVNRSDN